MIGPRRIPAIQMEAHGILPKCCVERLWRGTKGLSLLADLATITRNTIILALSAAPGWDQDTDPTQLQKKILDLLNTLPNQ